MIYGVLLILCGQLLGSRAQQIPEWRADIKSNSEILVRLVREKKDDKVITELNRLEAKYVKGGDPDRQLICMSAFLLAIDLEMIEVNGDKIEHNEPPLRHACRPYAEAIVKRELKIPVDPELMKAQLTALFRILDETRYWDTVARLKKDDDLRRAQVQEFVNAWQPVARSYAFWLREFPEEVLNGRESSNPPSIPRSLSAYSSGVSPESIEDANDRKVYEAYLADLKSHHRKVFDGRNTTSVRNFYLVQMRSALERLYGPDRKTWNELREIIASTVEDQELAEQIRKDLTRTKQP